MFPRGPRDQRRQDPDHAIIPRPQAQPATAAARLCVRIRHGSPNSFDNTEPYKYLGVHFSNTGNPSDYMPQARRTVAGSYSSMRQRYCGLACGKHVRLQLQLFSAIVTSAAMYCGELWGVHPRTAAERGQHRNTRNFCGSCCGSHPAPAQRHS